MRLITPAKIMVCKGKGSTNIIQSYAYQDNEPKAGLITTSARSIPTVPPTGYSSVRAVGMQEPAINETV
jgi:hypothetical protein